MGHKASRYNLGCRRVLKSILTLRTSVFMGFTAVLLLAVSPAVHADINGKIVKGPMSCKANPYLSASSLCQAMNGFGLKCQVLADNCETVSQEMFTGAVIETASPKNMKGWNGFGGLGMQYAQAAVCLMRDLSDMKGQKISFDAVASVNGLGAFKSSAEMGFLSFDKSTGVFSGYNRLKACGPIIGCVEAYTQKFKLTPVISKVAGAGKKAGEYEIRQAYGIEFMAEELRQKFQVDFPQISVATPVGPVSIIPKLEIGRSTSFITAPFGQNVTSSHPDGGLDGIMANQTWDIYGRNPGVVATAGSLFDFVPEGKPNWRYSPRGWLSQIALGGRDASIDGKPWEAASGNPFPARPDYNMKQARSDKEKSPNASLLAETRVEYGLPIDLFGGIFKGITCNGPVQICIEKANVYAAPQIRANFSSQVLFLQNEQAIWNKKTLTRPGLAFPYPDVMVTNFDQSRTFSILPSATTAAGFGIETGLNLKIRLGIDLLFTSINKVIVDISPKTSTLISQTVGNSVPDAGARAYTQGSVGLKEKRFFQNMTLFDRSEISKRGTDGGLEHLTQCFAQNTPDGKMPDEPTFAPGDPSRLASEAAFPCNICVGWDETKYKDDQGVDRVMESQVGVIFQSSQAGMPKGTKWNCDIPQKTGCYDLCKLDKNGNKHVLKTAIQLIRDGEAKDMPGWRYCAKDAY